MKKIYSPSKDFDTLKSKFELFTNPMTVDDISVQPNDFQIELCDWRTVSFLYLKVNLSPKEFRK